MTPVLIATGSNNTGAATVVLTVPIGGVPANSQIMLAIATEPFNLTKGTAVDTAGNSYSVLSNNAFPNNSSANGEICFLQTGAGTGGSASLALSSGNTITFTKHSSSDVVAISAIYVPNITLVSQFDQDVVAMGSSAAPSISITPTSSGELFIGFLMTQGTSADTFTQASGWAAPPNRVGIAATNGPTIAGGFIQGAGLTAQTWAPSEEDIHDDD